MTDHKGNVISNSLSGQSKKFKILIPVWGEVYIDRLVKFTLSSMLPSDNQLLVLLYIIKIHAIYNEYLNRNNNFSKGSHLYKYDSNYRGDMLTLSIL